MSLITESVLRSRFRQGVPQNIDVYKGDIITPSAKQYLREKGVEIQWKSETIKKTSEKGEKEEPYKTNTYKGFEVVEKDFQPKFVSAYDGGMYAEKPEYMTHLYGNKLVFKDDERIVFRGKLDHFQSQILMVQSLVEKLGMKQLSVDLEEILTLTRNILMSEVKNIPMEPITLFGLDDGMIRAHSHNPMKYYGVQHFVPNVHMGDVVINLNMLRTSVRELEVAAMKTFRQGTNVKHPMMIQALNRLSSGIYILMCQTLSEAEKNRK